MNFLTKGSDLPTTIITKLKANPPGRVLDAGCGQGVIAKALFQEGFESHACDIDKERFLPCPEGIDFQLVDLNGKLPYPDNYFDYICCTEVIEHVDDPFAFIAEFRRVLKDKGLLYISTPNILNMQSRIRYLLEGTYQYFKYPVIEWMEDGTKDLHINPIRLHECEYYMHRNNMQIEEIFTSKILYKYRLFFWPIELISKLLMKIKDKRSSRPGEISTVRLYKIMKRPELLYGEHLILKARKVSRIPSKYHVC